MALCISEARAEDLTLPELPLLEAIRSVKLVVSGTMVTFTATGSSSALQVKWVTLQADAGRGLTLLLRTMRVPVASLTELWIHGDITILEIGEMLEAMPALTTIICDSIVMTRLLGFLLVPMRDDPTSLIPALSTLRCYGEPPILQLLTRFVQARFQRGFPLRQLIINGLHEDDVVGFHLALAPYILDSIDTGVSAAPFRLTLPSICTEETHEYWRWDEEFVSSG